MTADIKRKSTGQLVFEDLQEKIISGEYTVGSNLPSERDLVTALGVSRSAVREALQRLAQSKLVTINHGGGTRVNNFKETAGLDLLKNLVGNKPLAIDLQIFRSLMEIRGALAVDAARLAALRRTEKQKDALLAKLEDMKMSQNSMELQQRTIEFWDIIIIASENIAYKLSMNTLKDNYSFFERFGENFSIKNYKFLHYQNLAQAIANKQQQKAEQAAKIVVNRDAEQLASVLKLFQSDTEKK
jgi:GntR family transcriptional regulator, transcriptional repressor for pyruvate dehydrogenase complex